MLRRIELHGDLAERFERFYDLHVSSAAEAGRALSVIVPGFKQHVMDKAYKVVRGDGFELSSDVLAMTLGKETHIHIIPAIYGAGGNVTRNAGKIIMGVALIGLSGPIGAFAGQGIAGLLVKTTVASIGWGMASTGVASLLSPAPDSPLSGPEGSLERPGQKPSFIFSGAQNVMEQGATIPLVYGQMRVGSIVIAAGIKTEEVPF